MVLEVAHVDGKRQNNDIENLVILCPTCHKMHDIDLISTETILQYERSTQGSRLVEADERCRSQSGPYTETACGYA